MKNKVIITLLIGIILIILASTVQAANATLTMTGENEVEVSKEGTIKVNITASEKIGVISGKISKNDKISSISCSGSGKWVLVAYNESTGEFNLVYAEGTESGEVMTIKYVATSNEGTGTIEITEIKGAAVEYEDITMSNVIKNVEIKKEVPPPALATLTGISVTTPPTKTAYNAGEIFDTTGMVVTAEYSDETTKVVTGYTINPDDELTAAIKAITISYTEGGVTKTATQTIKVDGVTEDKDENKEVEKENNVATDGNKEVEKENNVATNSIPQAGIEDYAIPTLGLAGIITIVSMIMYKKYRIF